MKLRLPIAAKKLRATATRRVASSRAVEDEYEEPTTNFSKAFVVVLLLHVVAFLGFYSFSSINAHRQVAGPAPAASEAPAVEKPAAAQLPAAAVTTDSAKVADSTAKKSGVAPALAGPKDSGEVYTVAKGETPERIAKKLSVSFNDLIKLNHIDDPRKLQIGQKLHVPQKRNQ